MICQLEQVSVQASAGRPPRLQPTNLRLAAGELVAIVGPNGAGKSTLLSVLAGLTPPSSGVVRWEGQPLHSLSPRERAAKVAWLPQRGSLAEPLAVGDVVAAARFRFAEGWADSRDAAQHALQAVGLPHLHDRAATQISGGESQRAALASLRAQEAQAWLLDEPANHLDPRQQVATYGFLGQAVRGGTTVVCVTHDLNLLQHAAPPARVRVLGLKDGALALDTHLDDPTLPTALGALFDATFDVLQRDGRRWFVMTDARAAWTQA